MVRAISGLSEVDLFLVVAKGLQVAFLFSGIPANGKVVCSAVTLKWVGCFQECMCLFLTLLVGNCGRSSRIAKLV